MRKEDGLTPAQAEFERALAGLQPMGTSIDRDALLYRAGYAAGHRRNRAWQGLAAMLAVGLTASLTMQGLASGSRGGMQTTDKDAGPQGVIFATAEPRTEYRYAGSGGSYLTLRNEVLEKGLAALPCPVSSSSSQEPPLTIEGLLGRGPRSAGAAGTSSDDGFSNPGGRS
jgi:hypothetical protein